HALPAVLPCFPYTTLFRSRRAAILHEAVPSASPDHSEGDRVGSVRVGLGCILGLVPPSVTAPLPDIPQHLIQAPCVRLLLANWVDRKSTRLNSSHLGISYA